MKASDTCHYCGQIGHWKGECPRRLHGFPKSVNAVDGTDSTDEDEGGEVKVVKAGRTAQTSQIALLSERVDKLFDLVGKGKSTKSGNTCRYPMKTDPQRDRNDGVSFFSLEPPPHQGGDCGVHAIEEDLSQWVLRDGISSVSDCLGSPKLLGYLRSCIFGTRIFVRALIDAGNLFSTLISEELTWKLNLQVQGRQRRVGTAEAGGEVVILGHVDRKVGTPPPELH